MRKILIFSAFMLLSSLHVLAQTNEQKAFQTFKKAREAFQNENFELSSELLLETKTLLGSTNIRIQPMLIKSLVEIEDWRQAKTEITTYYNLNPDRELIEYQEIADLKKTVENKIYEEEQLYSSAKRNTSVDEYTIYLYRYPHGKYRTEVQNLLSNQKDENAWQSAVYTDSVSSYYEYLDAFPHGNYAETATAIIMQRDLEAYEKASAKGTQEALNYYLDNFPRGEYRTYALMELLIREEYDMYIRAKNSSYIENCEAYIKKYPDGEYADEINRIIQNSYFKFGNDAFSSRNYKRAKEHYKTYLSKFPYGSYSYEVRRKIKKCERRINQRSVGFIAYAYDSISPVGISFGNLNKNGIGFYGKLKLHTDIFTGLNGTIDNAGNTDINLYTEAQTHRRLNEIRNPNISLSSGLTIKVVYPLYMYIGGGAIYASEYDRWEAIDPNYVLQDVDRTYYLRNTDKTRFDFFPESGLILKVSNALVLKYGVSYHTDILHQFGLGFQL